MTRKITVRRHSDGGWRVVRPAFGFGSSTITVYPTGAAAIASLTRQGLGGAGLTERGTGQLARRPRRILAEIDRVLAECDATHLPPLGMTWPPRRPTRRGGSQQ